MNLNDEFKDIDEKLFRAVYPESKRPKFWKNGKLSSAVFKDPKGLSVDRSGGRDEKLVYNSLTKKFEGQFFYVKVKDCMDIDVFIKYAPSNNNKFHSELHRDKNKKCLSDLQAKILARRAKELINS